MNSPFSLWASLTMGALPLLSAAVPPDAGPEPYDVTWRAPSADHTGSMPLGNGEIGVNAWVEPSGDLLLYISRTDTWGDNGRLLKVGRVRIHADPPIWREDMPFTQRLNLLTGTLTVQCGEGDQAADIRLWVDANHPAIHVSATTAAPSVLSAALELWRTEPHELPSIEVSDTYVHADQPGGQHAPTIVEPDTVVTGLQGAIGWYHRNTKSVGPELTARIQGLADLPVPDPLLHRIFGGLITGNGARRIDDQRLELPRGTEHALLITVMTLHPATAAEWLSTSLETAAAIESMPPDQTRARHEAWWQSFWDRSWIHVTPRTDVAAEPAPAIIPANALPLRLGTDQNGQSRFAGTIDRASIWQRALSRADIARLAADPQGLPLTPGEAGLIGSWQPLPGVEVDLSQADLTGAVTIEAWLQPEQMPANGARIVDKITPGMSDGFLLDTYPGNSLRFIAGPDILLIHGILTPGIRHHVAAVVDPEAGGIVVYHNGEAMARAALERGEDTHIVSRAYALQRYI